MTIFCDTNIISELARPRPNPGVIVWSQNIESLSISVITLEEITYGLNAKPNRVFKLGLTDFYQHIALCYQLHSPRFLASLRSSRRTRGNLMSNVADA
jgi:predicted nucleic acid-binding protein